MRLLLVSFLLIPQAALACSMVLLPPNLGLPGAVAGPTAVFTTASGGILLGPDDTEIAVTRAPYRINGSEAEMLVPVEPLAPGNYRVEPCDFGIPCEVNITEDAGDPGLPPAMPELLFESARIWTGRHANCGPTVPGTEVIAESDAPVVVFAAEPLDSLVGAALLGFAQPDGEEGARWITEHEGDIFAAAVDAEGELSEWSGPHALKAGACSTSGDGPFGLALSTLAFLLAFRRRAN